MLARNSAVEDACGRFCFDVLNVERNELIGLSWFWVTVFIHAATEVWLMLTVQSLYSRELRT